MKAPQGPGAKWPSTVPSGHDAPAKSSSDRRREQAPDRVVWVNGRLCRGLEAMLPVFDRGARDGEGLFETVRVEGRRPLWWGRHLERLVVSAAELGFPVPPRPDDLKQAVDQVLAANDLSDAALRITVTRGIPGGRPTRAGCWIEAEPLAARLWRGTQAGGATLVFSSVPFAPGPLGRFKTTSRIAYNLAREEARIRRADEALLVTSDGEVLEGSVSNVFVVSSHVVLTPPLERGILAGIVRAQVLQACATVGFEVREIPLRVADLEGADEVFVTNALQQVVPAAMLAGRATPGRAVAMRLAEACRAQCLGNPC